MMKRFLANLGGFLAISGIISSVLYLIDYNLKILMWIDSWGSTMGWVIRGGLILAGAALFFLIGHSTGEEPKADEDQ